MHRPLTLKTLWIAATTVSISLNAASVTAQPGFTAVPAPEWTAIVDRHSGWTGSDGIFSIPLDGIETAGNYLEGRTLFLFSDTFIGEVDPVTDDRLAGTVMINNTLAYRNPGPPTPASTHFWWRNALGAGDPVSAFLPNTPDAQPGHYYWLSDGIALPQGVFIFANRMYNEDGWFYRSGLALIRIPPGSQPPFNNQTQTDLHFMEGPEQGGWGERWFGAGILTNIAYAGAPDPDGYVYLYGIREDWLNKKLLVARAPYTQVMNPGAWRFYQGQGVWGTDVNAAEPITDRVSPEMSVSPLPDGRYILVFQLDTITRFTAVRIGLDPWGPWSNHTVVYEAPEPQQFGQGVVFMYNAKAHPHLSDPGELLFSYNVNSQDFWDHFDHADIYHPRFVRLSADAQSIAAIEAAAEDASLRALPDEDLWRAYHRMRGWNSSSTR